MSRVKTDAERLQPLQDILAEISRAYDGGAVLAALSMIFVGIDTMSWLSLPKGKLSHTRRDFIAWVDKYLKADPTERYQYTGRDVYAARCAFLHSYGSTANMHRAPNPPRRFGYVNSGRHLYDPAVSTDLAIISIAMLSRDFKNAVLSFLEDARKNPGLRQRIASRIDELHNITNIPNGA